MPHQGRQHLLANRGKHGRIAPCCGGDEVVQRLVQALAARDRRQALAELTQLQQQEPRSEALIQSLKSATLALPQTH